MPGPSFPNLQVVSSGGTQAGSTSTAEQVQQTDSTQIAEVQTSNVGPGTEPSPLQGTVAPFLMELVSAALAGAGIGALAAPKTKRSQGAAVGSLGALGVYGLLRAVLRPQIPGGTLSTAGRTAMGVVGVGTLAGSVYLGALRKTKK